MDFFISTAHATAETAATGPGAMASLFPLIVVILVFWLFVIRPQAKKIRAHETLVKGLKRGDTITTNGGIIGKITKANDDDTQIDVEIAAGVVVKVDRTMIHGLTAKDEPKAANSN